MARSKSKLVVFNNDKQPGDFSRRRAKNKSCGSLRAPTQKRAREATKKMTTIPCLSGIIGNFSFWLCCVTSFAVLSLSMHKMKVYEDNKIEEVCALLPMDEDVASSAVSERKLEK